MTQRLKASQLMRVTQGDGRLAKATRQLAGVQARLARGRTRKERDKVEAEIAVILKPRWCERVITWSLSGESATDFRLSFNVDEPAREVLEEELFGKRVLFTDLNDWTIGAAVAA